MSDTDRDLQPFLDALCVEWGFCRLRVEGLLEDGKSLTSPAFARAVLLAEGMDPDAEIAWMRKLKRRFSDRYGARL